MFYTFLRRRYSYKYGFQIHSVTDIGEGFYIGHHGSIIINPNPKIRKARNYFYKKGRVVPVTISEESAKSFKQAYGLTIDQMIYNGRDMPTKTAQYDRVVAEIETFKKNVKTKVFINIGRQEEQKNQLMLVDAFQQLMHKDRADAILLIMGGGRNNEVSLSIQKKLKEIAENNEGVFLLGEKKNATDYLQVADFFCLSSLFEGMPITLIEAFATGTIPVCTPVGGIPEMLQDLDKGLCSKSVSPSNYYDVLKRVYDLSLEEQQQLKEQAQKLFKDRYSMTHCAKKYLKVYETSPTGN